MKTADWIMVGALALGGVVVLVATNQPKPAAAPPAAVPASDPFSAIGAVAKGVGDLFNSGRALFTQLFP